MVKAAKGRTNMAPSFLGQRDSELRRVGKAIKPLSLLILSTGFASSVMAEAPSMDFVVGGQIAPGSCTVTAQDSGNYDFGDMSSSLIKPATNTLASKKQSWNIDCDAPTYLMVSSNDNRTDSAASNAYNAFGLGQNGETGKVGYYTALMSNLMVDGNQVKAGGYTNSDSSTYSINSPSDRTFQVYNELYFPSKNGLWIAWANSANTLSVGRNFTADITVTPVLARYADFGDIKNDVDLDGSMTMKFSFGI